MFIMIYKIIYTHCIFFMFLIPIACCQKGSHVSGTRRRKDDFHEQLILKPITNELVAARMTFVSNKFDNDFRSFDLVGKAIGELVQLYSIASLELSLAQGDWRTRLWGPAIDPNAGPSGAELRVSFLPRLPVSLVDATWRELVNALSGMFCASLGQMVPTLTVQPGPIPGWVNSTRTRYATLSSENVCTENLTPWKKLLPCGDFAGISTLLNPPRLFSSKYFVMTLSLNYSCAASPSAKIQNCSTPKLSVKQSMLALLPHPGRASYNLRQLFGYPILGACHLAKSSQILVSTVFNLAPCEKYQFLPQYTKLVRSEGSMADHLEWAMFDLKAHNAANGENDVDKNFNLEIDKVSVENCTSTKSQNSLTNLEICQQQMDCYVAGSGQQEGKFVCNLRGLNSGILKTDDSRGSKGHTIVYKHLIPWYLRVYFHTFSVVCTNHSFLSSGAGAASFRLRPLYTHQMPSLIRQRPSYIESMLHIPSSVDYCRISIEFDKMLLRWTEYPPDAHRGFHVPAPVVLVERAGTSSLTALPGCSGRINGQPFLVNLPTPDFSMPYNVICLVCTVVALAFGPIHNLTTKEMVLKDPAELAAQGIAAQVQGKLKSLVAKLKGKISRKKPEEAVSEAKSKEE